MKACAACGLVKDNTEFTKNKSLRSGLNSSCKSCVRTRSRVQYHKHKEKRLADKAVYRKKNRERLRAEAMEYRKVSWDKNKQWRTANRERIRLNSQRRRAKLRDAKTFTVSVKEINSILLKPCVYCGDKSEHIDHVIPLSRGGSHSIGNLAPSCSSCNLRKNNKLVIEWKASKR